MSLLSVIKEKCGGDGKCAAVCPVRIIVMDASTNLPKLVEGGAKIFFALYFIDSRMKKH